MTESNAWSRSARPRRAAASIGALCAALAGCASTSVTIDPPQPPTVCDAGARALVLWAPRWRPGQKDVAQREAAAESGLRRFLATSGCFGAAELQRFAGDAAAHVGTLPPARRGRFDKLLAVRVLELGPVVKLLSSALLVEGGTVVELEITEFDGPSAAEARRFTVAWRHGGPGIVKGVAGLPDDLAAALRSALLDTAAARR